MNRAQRRVLIGGFLVLALFLHSFLCEWGGLGIKALPSVKQGFRLPQEVDVFTWLYEHRIWDVSFQLGETEYTLELFTDEGISRTAAVIFGILVPLLFVFMAGFLCLGSKSQLDPGSPPQNAEPSQDQR